MNAASLSMLDDVIAEEDIIDDSPEEDTPLDIAPERRRVITEPQDPVIDTLSRWIKKRQLNIQPSFQRNFVWNNVKASRLIESLLLSIPIPVVYVAEEVDGKYSVVDGQQRLTSIQSFIDGKYPDGRDFRLSSLQVLTELNGKAFADCDDSVQETILGRTLRLIIIKRESDPDVKFEVFARLNLGAERLNDQELRNCIYRGNYNDLLADLTSNSYMLKIMHAQSPHYRMADRQLILRFFAMCRNTHLKYRGPMKRF